MEVADRQVGLPLGQAPIDARIGAGAFEETIVEAHETEGVPVVQKKANVAEEVVIHREATDGTEKVRDSSGAKGPR